MNRKMRRKLAPGISRDDKIQSERGKQIAHREMKCLHSEVVPYMQKKSEELVPKPIMAISKFLSKTSLFMRKFIGHIPPLFFGRLVSSMMNNIILAPFPRLVSYTIILFVSLAAIPLSIVGVLLDIFILIPIDWAVNFTGKFGLSIRVTKDNEWGTTSILTIKKWWRVVDTKSFSY